MKTFNQWSKWSIREGKKERDEEMEQLTHDMTVQFIKKNPDLLYGIIRAKVPELVDAEMPTNQGDSDG